MLKLDFENAYDMIDWDCLLEMLELRCFDNKWIS